MTFYLFIWQLMEVSTPGKVNDATWVITHSITTLAYKKGFPRADIFE